MAERRVRLTAEKNELEAGTGSEPGTHVDVQLRLGRLYRFSCDFPVVMTWSGRRPSMGDLRVEPGDAMECEADVESIKVSASTTNPTKFWVQEEAGPRKD